MLDEKLDGANEIRVMNPRDVLAPVAGASTETAAHQAEQRVEDSTPIGAHDHGRTHQDAPRVRDARRVARTFPVLRDLDAEMPRGRRTRFVTADLSGCLIVGGIEAVRVDRGGAGLQP